MKQLDDLLFDNTYARLPDAFHATVQPQPLSNPYLASFSRQAAELIDLDPAVFTTAAAVRAFNGEWRLPGSQPIAQLYAGHQFGHYVPQLGDGRAILLGEVVNDAGERWELQLKGAGLTPFSRDGDGRAVLRSTIREFLCSEAMAGLGIPTTRALCLVSSDEEVYREQIETGAMLLRMAPSHVRFGTFEVFFYRDQHHRLRELADYVIGHDYPQYCDAENRYAALLSDIVQRTARLLAQWQLVGFSHGVMNTDNMSVLGLTIDYGPFGFLDRYDPEFVCNHSDYHGRYAFDQQPNIGLWNLTCLAQAFLPLLDPDDGEAAAQVARDILQAYEPELIAAYSNGVRAKLGLETRDDRDRQLSASLLQLLQTNQVDYNNFFRALSHMSIVPSAADDAVRDLFVDRAACDRWLSDYRERLRVESADDRQRQHAMLRVNPKYILRNYLAQQAIELAEKGDFLEVDRLLQVLSRPFEEHDQYAHYAALPPDWAGGIEVSCSS